jgi:5'-nucleotidase
MVHQRVRIPVIALITLAILVALTGIGAAGPKTTVELQILAVNDFHGALETNGNFGGAEYLATYVKNREATNPNTIFISGGDLIGASPLLSGIFHDEPTIEAFNLMGLDYAVVGNHEFDEGVEELKRMQEGGCHPADGCQDGDDFLGAEFKFLSANVIQTKNGQTLFSAYKTRAYMGVQVAYVGIALESTPSIVTASGTEGVEFLDEAEVINSIVAELKEKGIKTIVIILHRSASCSTTSGIVGNTDPEIDVFITGHSHSNYACIPDDRVVVSQAGSSGGYLTDIDLTLDRETGQVIARSVENVRIDKRLVENDETITNLLAKYKTYADPIANQVIGTITADITRSSNPAGESALGDVIADAQLEATAPADKGGAVIAFMNPGGIRANLTHSQISGGEQPGEVTFGEAFTVQPFSNTLVTMTMTGQQIKDLLESRWSGCVSLQISNGFTYSWSPSAPVGSRVSDIQINGEPIDLAANYRITTNNFLADGGDGCTVFTQGTDRLVGMDDLEALVQYFGAHSPVAPGPQNRITRLP